MDKALANDDQYSIFPNAQIENVVADKSYQYPILVNLEPIVRVELAKSSNMRIHGMWSVGSMMLLLQRVDILMSIIQ